LADAELPGAAERLKPGDLGGLVGWAKIQMEPVLDGLALGNLEEYQVGRDAVLRAARWRLESDLVFLLPGTAPAQRRFPEAGDPGRVGGVQAQALDAYFHALIVFSAGVPCPEIDAQGFLARPGEATPGNPHVTVSRRTRS
jgi:hypothetical protein